VNFLDDTQHRALIVSGGVVVWASSVYASSSFVGATQEGVEQIAQSWPMLATIGGGIVAAFWAATKIVDLYRAWQIAIREMVREELKVDRIEQAQKLEEILRRVTQVERIVDSRRTEAPPPFSRTRIGRDESGGGE
jgi:hypothetical protein